MVFRERAKQLCGILSVTAVHMFIYFPTTSCSDLGRQAIQGDRFSDNSVDRGEEVSGVL